MRIVLLDPHAMFRDAFSCLLALRGHDVVARSGSVLDLLEWADDEPGDDRLADVVVAELDLPDIPGTVAVGKIRAAFPNLPIAILTGETQLRPLRAVLDAGADGVALKTEGVDEVERVLLRLTSPLSGRRRQTDDPQKNWSRGARALAHRSSRSSANQLPTRRELEIIRLLVQGESTGQIGRIMGVRNATVRTHLQHLFIKFGVHSRLELVAFAVRTGLVEGPLRPRADYATW